MKFGIIGCGGIAKWHINAIADLDNAPVTAVCDTRESVSNQWAEKYHATPFYSVDAMLDSGIVDAVAICTPSGTHAELAQKALHNGIHAIIEKPMAITRQSLSTLMDTVHKSKAELFPISQLRYSDDIKLAKEIISSQKLGRITLCDLSMKYFREHSYYTDQPWRGTKNMDGGALMNQGIHGIDLLRYLCGEVSEIQSFKDTLYHPIETEDSFAASLRFSSGALGVVTAGTATYPGFDRRFEICGTNGSLVLTEDQIVQLHIVGEAPIFKVPSQNSGAHNPFSIDYEPHLRQYKNIAAHLATGEPLIINAEDAAKTIELIFSMYQAT